MLQTNKVPKNQQNFDNPRDEHWTPIKLIPRAQYIMNAARSSSPVVRAV